MAGISESRRNPWAMVEPNGPAAARSPSTWIHWWSSVASAKASIRSWVIVVHSPTPMDDPTMDRKSSMDTFPPVRWRRDLRRYRSEGGTFSGDGRRPSRARAPTPSSLP